MRPGEAVLVAQSFLRAKVCIGESSAIIASLTLRPLPVRPVMKAFRQPPRIF
jgi:hypothetical protein